MTDHNISFWRAGLSFEEMIQTLDYYTSPPYLKGYPPKTMVVPEIPRLSFSEAMFDLHKPVGCPGGFPTLRPEQKPFDLLCHAIWKFTQPGSMVLDPFFGTGATVSACLLEPEPLSLRDLN